MTSLVEIGVLRKPEYLPKFSPNICIHVHVFVLCLWLYLASHGPTLELGQTKGSEKRWSGFQFCGWRPCRWACSEAGVVHVLV